ncbi:MAG: MBL fold metallo-hydrolase [Ruminococcus sp.]
MTEIKTYQVGIMETNSYVIRDLDTSAMAIVDPGEYSKEAVGYIKYNGGNLEMILLTHGHFDHITGVSEYKKKFPNAKVYIGEKDFPSLENDDLNLSNKMASRKFPHFSADTLKDGDVLTLGNTKIKYMETPGHTRGSGCFIFDDNIMSGDTLFCESCGRTDFADSSTVSMIKSLLKIASIEGEYNILPGHMESTTLSHEKKYNPFMNTSYEDIY